jgi:ribonuclease/clavin/mitogillin
MTIVNVGYRSTNFWVISEGTSRLLVDLGWPGTAGALLANLGRKGIPLSEVRYGLATHFHMDHAGAAQDLKDRGMTLVVTPEQVSSIEPMRLVMKPEDRYTPIVTAGNLVVTIAGSRAFLASIGLAGQLIHTPGHSDDSVSLLLDSGDVFTGDLTAPWLATEETQDVVRDSWQRLKSAGARTVRPGHGGVRPL